MGDGGAQQTCAYSVLQAWHLGFKVVTILSLGKTGDWREVGRVGCCAFLPPLPFLLSLQSI